MAAPRRVATQAAAARATKVNPTPAPAPAVEEEVFQGVDLENEDGFLKYAVQLAHSWELVETKKLTPAEMSLIKEARVKPGQYGPQLQMFCNDGSTRVMNLSTFSNLEVGDRVRVSTITIDQLYDAEEDRSIFRANGQRM